MNVDEQAQIQLLALSLKELIQSSAMTALDQLFVFLAVIMRSLGEIRCHGGNRITRKDELTPDYARKDELTPDYAPVGVRRTISVTPSMLSASASISPSRSTILNTLMARTPHQRSTVDSETVPPGAETLSFRIRFRPEEHPISG